MGFGGPKRRRQKFEGDEGAGPPPPDLAVRGDRGAVFTERAGDDETAGRDERRTASGVHGDVAAGHHPKPVMSSDNEFGLSLNPAKLCVRQQLI